MIKQTPPQEAFNELTRYFMGEEWVVGLSEICDDSEKQNSILVNDIKATYPKWLVKLARFLFLGI